jgi:hypothetical protein
VRPLAHRSTCVRAGLEDDEVHPALGGVGGGGQPDGSGADDDHGVLHDGLLKLDLSIDGCR